jgi:pimeloyl-ACP methyl ester carboxylesterase
MTQAPATLDARGRRQRERTIRSPGFAKIIVSPAAMTKRKTILDRSDIRLVWHTMNLSLRRSLRTAFRWISRVLAVIALLIAAIVIVSRVAAAAREREAAEQAAPSTGHFVLAGDLQMYVQEAGPSNGPPIVLVHGTGAWSEIWRETMTALADAGFHAIAIDVPPFGYSGKLPGPSSYSPDKQAGRIAAALDALGLRGVVLVGHSVGARPTVETALLAPGRIERLVLVDPALGFGVEGSSEFQQNDPSFLMKALFGVRGVRNAVLSIVATNPLTTRALFQTFVSNTAAVTDARVTMLQQPLVVENTTTAEGDWLHYLMLSEDRSLVSDFKNFAKLTMPVLLIWGSTDTVTPLWQGRQLQQLIPHAELSVLDNVGHIPYIEDATAFNDMLVRYLQARH